MRISRTLRLICEPDIQDEVLETCDNYLRPDQVAWFARQFLSMVDPDRTAGELVRALDTISYQNNKAA